MNCVKSSLLLLIFILKCCMLLALQPSDSDNTLNDLYENLLHWEYTGPISLSNHQVERKAQRSPSLRLRFGRSDPALSPFRDALYVKRFSDEINKKPIRSPSLRLRFGKRNPPSPYVIYDDIYDANEIDNVNNIDDNLNREQRIPSTRLRFGRRNMFSDDGGSSRIMDNINNSFDDDDVDGDAITTSNIYTTNMNRNIRKPSLKLRFGRRSDLSPLLEMPQEEKRKPKLLLRFGRNSFNNNNNNDDDKEMEMNESSNLVVAQDDTPSPNINNNNKNLNNNNSASD